MTDNQRWELIRWRNLIVTISIALGLVGYLAFNEVMWAWQFLVFCITLVIGGASTNRELRDLGAFDKDPDVPV